MESDSSEDQIMEVFKQHYSPVESIADSDDQMTTDEVYNKFISLSRDKSFTVNMMKPLMERSGFKYCYFIDGFVWLLKINTHP